MLIYNAVIAGLWLVLIVYWFVSAIGVKRSLGRPWAWQWEMGVRLVLAALILLAFRLSALRPVREELEAYLINTSAVRGDETVRFYRPLKK